MLSTTKCWQVMSTKSFGMSLWHVSTFAMKNSKFLTLLNKGGTTEKLATKATDDSRRLNTYDSELFYRFLTASRRCNSILGMAIISKKYFIGILQNQINQKDF